MMNERSVQEQKVTFIRERPIRDLQPMSDVAMTISTDADTDADVARLDCLAK